MTPKELAADLWGQEAAAEPKGKPQRLIRQVARDLWGEAPGGRWHFNERQIAAVGFRVPATPPT
jgi:hypothetical protein